MTLKFLLTNDDGVHAPGLKALEEALRELGDVTVVAPDREQSGCSHSISLATPVRVRRTDLRPGFHAASGTPADCVLVGLYQICSERPDFVVSGINRGGNLGSDVLYSGTVQSAAEGALHGIPSVAFSLVAFERPDYSFAAKFAGAFMRALAEHRGWDEGHERELHGAPLWNVNIPLHPEQGDPQRALLTRLGKRRAGAEIVAKRHDPHGLPYYWTTTAFSGFDPIPGTDCVAIADNAVSVTPLALDWTRLPALERLAGMNVAGIKLAVSDGAK